MYSHLFTVEEVSDELWEEQLNPKSEVVLPNAMVWLCSLSLTVSIF